MAGKYVPPGRRDASNAAPVPMSESASYVSKINASNARAYFTSQSSTFRELDITKKEFAENPNVEEMFDQQRVQSTDQSISKTFAEQFFTCMEDINETADSILVGTVKSYLDLGCSPGGFSSWVMEKNPAAKGLGFTLPPEMGGLPMVRMPEGSYEVCYQDITRMKEVAARIEGHGMNGGVDLVTAACIYRDQDTSKSRRDAVPELTVASASRTILSLVQISIALQTLKNGGHFVFVLSNKPDPSVIQTLAVLRSLFEDLLPCKGKSLHGIRSSFYLFCKGFKRTSYLEQETSSLLLSAIRETAEVGSKKDANAETSLVAKASDSNRQDQEIPLTLHPADLIWLPGYTEESLLKQEGPFVATFFEDLWNGQIKAIKRKTAELNQQSKSGRRGIPPSQGASSWRSRAETVDTLDASEQPHISAWKRGSGNRTTLTRREVAPKRSGRSEDKAPKQKPPANRFAGLGESEDMDDQDD